MADDIEEQIRACQHELLSGARPLDTLTATPQEQRLASELLPVLYPQVRALARRERRALSGGETMRTTALVNEAWLKLRHSPEFADPQHFLRTAAIAIRHALVSYARVRLAEKRGGGQSPLPLDVALEMGLDMADTRTTPADDEALLVQVADLLGRLASLNPRLAQVVECRFYAGYSEEETATALGITARTVRRDWVKARAWLMQALEG